MFVFACSLNIYDQDNFGLGLGLGLWLSSDFI